MRIAITREVSQSFPDCALTFREREPIDLAAARREHEEYRGCLAEMVDATLQLDPLDDLPDAVFVEDPALVLDEVAIITRPALAPRRRERSTLADVLGDFRPLVFVEGPATLEGGDVFRVERTLYVGRSRRTNADGVAQLRAAVEPHGYAVAEVEVRECLHLKSACCPLGGRRVLAQRAWLDPTPLGDCEIIEVPEEEPAAANVLAIDRKVLLPAVHPRTAELLSQHGLEVLTVSNPELLKAESGVTCSSLIFEADGPIPPTSAPGS